MRATIIFLFIFLSLISDNKLPVVKIFYTSFTSLDSYYKDRNFFINAEYGRANQVILEDPYLYYSVIKELKALEKTQSLKDSVGNYYLRAVCLLSYESQNDTLELFTSSFWDCIKYKDKYYKNDIGNEIFRKIGENVSYNIYLQYIKNKRYYDSLENEDNKK